MADVVVLVLVVGVGPSFISRRAYVFLMCLGVEDA
jgi:hypothetical protein